MSREFNFADSRFQKISRELNFVDVGENREIHEIFFPRKFLPLRYMVMADLQCSLLPQGKAQLHIYSRRKLRNFNGSVKI